MAGHLHRPKKQLQPTNMLFKTIQDVKTYFNVDANTKFDTLKPYIQAAEDNYIVQVLGEALYAALDTAVSTNTFTAEETALLKEVRKPTIQLAMYLGFPHLALRINDTGIMKANTEDYNAADKGEIYFARVQCLIDGYRAIDSLYRFLETNAADYPDWTSSAAYSRYKDHFVNTAETFGIHTGMYSRLFFTKAQASMAIQELLKVQGFIGEAFYIDLKAKYKAGNASLVEQELIGLLCKPIALYTYAACLVDPDTREVIRIINAKTADELTQKNINSKDYKQEYYELSQLKENEASALMAQVKSYLNATASASVFALYYSSEKYKAPGTPKYNNGINDSSSSTFSMI